MNKQFYMRTKWLCMDHSCPILPAFVSGTPDFPLCMQGMMVEYCSEDPMQKMIEYSQHPMNYVTQ